AERQGAKLPPRAAARWRRPNQSLKLTGRAPEAGGGPRGDRAACSLAPWRSAAQRLAQSLLFPSIGRTAPSHGAYTCSFAGDPHREQKAHGNRSQRRFLCELLHRHRLSAYWCLRVLERAEGKRTKTRVRALTRPRQTRNNLGRPSWRDSVVAGSQ